MANAWLNVDLIASEALMIMSDELVIGNLATRDTTSEFNTAPNGYKVGDTIRIKTRPDYTVNEFSSTISTQSIRESNRSMQIEKWFDVSVAVTAREKALDLESFSEQVIRPASRRIAEKIDTYLGTKIMGAHGLYPSDTLFESAADIALARKAANLQQLDMNRFCLVNPDLEATILGQTWFNQSQTRGTAGEATLASGNMGRVMGMDFYSSVNFPDASLTGGTMVCVTNNTSGTKNLIGDTTLTVDTQTSSKVLKAGDRIHIAGCKRPLLVKTAIADTSSTTSVELVDPITEIVPDNAAVTVIGNNSAMVFKGAIFDDRSIAIAMPMLDSPSDKPSFAISDNGYSLRVVQGYDMSTKTETLSIDCLVGALAYDPRRITLLAGY